LVPQQAKLSRFEALLRSRPVEPRRLPRVELAKRLI
jgi:hypothetical protein